MVIGGCRPQTDNVPAVFLNHFVRADDIAQRLVHCLSFAVHGPTVCQHLAVGSSLSFGADRRQQRGLEPATVLVAAFQIDIRRPTHSLAVLQHGKVRGTGVKPTVQRIGFLCKRTAAAEGAGSALGQNLRRLMRKPAVGAFLCEKRGNGVDALLVADRLPAVFAVKYGNGKPPLTLTGDTPVGTFTDHLDHAILAPSREPFDLMACRNRLITECFHRTEPLRRRPENDRRFAPPAVRILVLKLLGGKQRAGFLHIRQNGIVGCGIIHSGILTGIGGLIPAVVHRHNDFHTVSLAGQVVVRTEAGRGVHTAGTGIHGDIIGVDNQRITVKERVPCTHILKFASGHPPQNLIGRNSALLHGLFTQRLGNDIVFPVFRPYNRISLCRIERNGKVAGKRPGGRGPDHKVGVAEINTRKLSLVVTDAEFYINGGTFVGIVLNFRLCKRGFVFGAPVDRLESLVDITLAVHLPENLDLPCLKRGIHGQIRVLPISQNAQADKLFPLNVHILLRKLMAGSAELRDRHLLAVDLVLFDDSRLNGHAVVVPSGHIRHAITGHCLVLIDKILQGLVHRSSHMDVSVGKGRSVVQNKQRLIRTVFQHGMIEINRFPIPEHLRFSLRQVRPHGKVGNR